MIHCLSTLTWLERLELGFKYPLSRPVRETRPLHPPTRSALPALTYFRFEGVYEYLEDLVTRIDAPLLHALEIAFFHQLIFDAPQLAQFVARTTNKPPDETRITFYSRYVEGHFQKKFVLAISCRQSDWQLSSLTQVCGSSFPEAFISTVQYLYICEGTDSQPRWQDDIEDSQWLEVLDPFIAVKDLCLSRNSRHVSFPPCKIGRGKCCPPFRIFSWRISTH